ncbi:hypothetical protein V1294_003891 [Bradyrhizobium sp. AZCC 1678]|uniref:Uncharacterized protein n=1 Tax=Bradyrhizobium algeriense TaxID=634784 RepID=A0ABU8BDJ8_9BRAD
MALVLITFSISLFSLSIFANVQRTTSDPEESDAVVCRLAPQGAPLLFPDNLVAPCSKCWRMVQFRPHAPKKPRRVCDECIRPEIEEHRKTEGVKYIITPNTATDLALYFHRKGRPQ